MISRDERHPPVAKTEGCRTLPDAQKETHMQSTMSDCCLVLIYEEYRA